MARKKGLGRGLEALLPTGYAEAVEEGAKDVPAGVEETKKTAEAAQPKAKKRAPRRTGATLSSTVQELSIDEIEANPEQPRKSFDESSLAELSASIKKYGLLQPILVKKYTAPGHAPYEIIAGERRFRAAQLAGLKKIPVILREEKERESHLLSVIENVQREDLNPLEEALAYRKVQEEQGMTQQELAEALGKSRSYIANTLRLLKLDEDSLEALRRGQLLSSQARTLLAEPDLKKRARYREQMIHGLANVNTIEKKTTKKKASAPDPFVSDLESQLQEALGTKVSIMKKRRGYQVQVDCYSPDDLERLLRRLSATEE